MRGGKFGVVIFLAFVFLGIAVACGSSDDDGVSSPGPAPTATTKPGEDASGLPVIDAGTDATSPKTDSASDVCITSKTCASHQCQPDHKGDDQPRGTCVENGTCVFIPASGKAPIVDAQCNGVIPCLGFVCVPTGIIAGPTGIFACGIAGDACTDEVGHRCCYAACSNGKCPGSP